MQFPIPDIYLTPGSGVAQVNKIFEEILKPETKMGDPQKFAEKIWQLLALPDPPLRLPLGPDAVDLIEGQLKRISSDVDAYKGWSADVLEQ